MALTAALSSSIVGVTAGLILVPGDPGYDACRRVFNAGIDRRPAAIWRCRSTEDVQRAIVAAQELGLPPTIRGGGHNVAGLAVSDGGLMIDLSRMREVHVDPVAFTVSVEGGCTWATVDSATVNYGAAVPGGTVSSTGVGGLTLGGGVGWLAGCAGLSCDYLIGADLVTADAQHRFVDLRADPDLLWALRGGGGNFGVVTRFHFNMFDVPAIVSGSIRLTLRELPLAIATLERVAPQIPDSLTCSLTLISDKLSDKYVSIDFACAAANTSHAIDVAAWFWSHFKQQPLPQLDFGYLKTQAMLDPAFVEPRRCYWRSCYINELSNDFSAALVDAFAECTSPSSVIILEHLHGAYSREPIGGAAFSQREHSFNLAIAAQWTSGAEDEVHKAWCKRTHNALTQFSCGSAYVNYVIPDQDVTSRQMYHEDSLARLRTVKTRVDPSNLFRANHNILPLSNLNSEASR